MINLISPVLISMQIIILLHVNADMQQTHTKLRGDDKTMHDIKIIFIKYSGTTSTSGSTTTTSTGAPPTTPAECLEAGGEELTTENGLETGSTTITVDGSENDEFTQAIVEGMI
jgi:hypothetical protein